MGQWLCLPPGDNALKEVFYEVGASVDRKHRDMWPIFRLKAVMLKYQEAWKFHYLGIAGCFEKTVGNREPIKGDSFIVCDLWEESSSFWQWLSDASKTGVVHISDVDLIMPEGVTGCQGDYNRSGPYGFPTEQWYFGWYRGSASHNYADGDLYELRRAMEEDIRSNYQLDNAEHFLSLQIDKDRKVNVQLHNCFIEFVLPLPVRVNKNLCESTTSAIITIDTRAPLTPSSLRVKYSRFPQIDNNRSTVEVFNKTEESGWHKGVIEVPRGPIYLWLEHDLIKPLDYHWGDDPLRCQATEDEMQMGKKLPRDKGPVVMNIGSMNNSLVQIGTSGSSQVQTAHAQGFDEDAQEFLSDFQDGCPTTLNDVGGIGVVNKVKALRQLIASIEGLKDQVEASPEFVGWRTNAEILIAECVGTDSHYMKKFSDISYHSRRKFFSNYSDPKSDFILGLEQARVVLESLAGTIEEHGGVIPATDKKESHDTKEKGITVIVNGNASGFQIQQDSDNSQQSQVFSYDPELKANIEKLVSGIKANLGQFGLSDEEEVSLKDKVLIVESEINKAYVNPSVVNKTLSFIKSLLERVPEHVAGHFAALGIVHMIGSLIK